MDGFVIGVIVLGGLGATVVWRVGRVRLRAVRMLGMTALLLCRMSAAAAPPEKPSDKAQNVADDEPKTPTLTRKIEEADKEPAKSDKDSPPQKAKKEETPKERYMRLVIAQVEKKWRSCLRLRSDAQSPGRLEVDFYINTDGKLDDIRVVNDRQSHLALTEVTLRAIIEAEIPPMPAEVIPSLPMNDPKRLKIQYTALISYAEPKKSDPKSGTKAAVDADKTAKGRYTRLVLAQVEKKWNEGRQQRGKEVSAGSLKAEFYVNKMGRVENVRIIDPKKSNTVLTEFTLQAIKDAEIPPMPADVISLLPKNDPERLKIQYDAAID